MSKEKNKWNSKKRNKLLKIIFGIPTGLWLIFWLIAMIPDPNEIEPLTWGDFILVNVVILPIWFAISFIITVVVSRLINKFSKNVEEKNTDKDETKEEMIVQNNIIEDKKETKRKDNKCLYTCESIVDAYEYKIMAKYFPKRMYWVFVLRWTYINILSSALLTIFLQSFELTFVLFIILEICAILICKFRLEHLAEKSFDSYLKRGIVDTNIETEFYEDYFIRKGTTASLTIKYSDITRTVENDTNFYLEYSQRNTIIIIQKNRCDLELISFIREKFNNLENHLGDSYKFKGVKKYHNPNFIKNGMMVLCILTILSFFASMWSFSVVSTLTNNHGFGFSKDAWVIWLWLPIPILSVVLGIKYRDAGFKCNENIIVGLIVGALLLINGSFCLFPTFTEDYSKIYEYQDIIGVQLPNDGTLQIQDWGTYFDENKTEYTIINAYYDEENAMTFVNGIENSSNWILSEDIKPYLKIFIPSTLVSDSDAYYSIYNSTVDEYNTIPKSPGTGAYEIYAMKYDKSDKKLEIHKFKYLYK